MTTVAFIGLGNMGSGMCANLVRAGLSVRAFDLDATARDRAVAAGATAATTIAEASKDASVVVTMLPAGEHVRAVYLGPDGVAAHARAGALFIDSSTIAVEDARAVIRATTEMGFDMVDAPVSGGVNAANGGTLTFMVGGTEAAFAKAQPVLANMGKAIVHAGGAGNGQVAKIANNMLLGITMIGTCEAFNLAERLGLDAQTFFDIASKASGQCWSMTAYCPAPGPVPTAPSNRDYQPGFAVGMMLKDLRLAVSAARDAGAPIPLGSSAERLYTELHADGFGDLDFSGIMKRIRRDI